MPKLSPDEKLERVKSQVFSMMNEGAQSIGCPYCGSENPYGRNPLCCFALMKAVSAVCDAVELLERITVAEKIYDRAMLN